MTSSRWDKIPDRLQSRMVGGTGGRVIGAKKTRKRQGPMSHPEDDEQEALFSWARLNVQRYPELEALYSIPNGAALAGKPKQRAMQMARLKKTGLRPGVSDVCLPIKRGPYGSLWIEMKAPGRLKGVSEDQKEWGALMVKLGNRFVVCDTWEKARDVILGYLT